MKAPLRHPNRLKSFRLPALIVLGALLAACSNQEAEQSFSTAVQGVYSAEFSQQGDLAAVGSIQHGGSLWRTEDAERLYNWNHKADTRTAITALAFSPDDKFVVTADINSIVLWDAHKGTALRFFDAPGEILYIALTPAAGKALLSMADNRAILFDIQRGGIVHQIALEASILSQAISGDGRYALFSLDNRQLQRWDLASATLEGQLETLGRVNTLAISGNGRYGFTSVQHRDASIIDLDSGEVVSNLKYNNKFFPSFSTFLTARFYNDGRQLLTGNTTGAMELWDTLTGQRLQRWITPKSASFGPTNFSVVAVAKADRTQQVLAMTSDGTTYRFPVQP